MSRKQVPQEWPDPGFDGHTRQQQRDIRLYTTPTERLKWLEEILLLFNPPPKKDYWTPETRSKDD